MPTILNRMLISFSTLVFSNLWRKPLGCPLLSLFYNKNRKLGIWSDYWMLIATTKNKMAGKTWIAMVTAIGSSRTNGRCICARG
jgi:hypothetical protein